MPQRKIAPPTPKLTLTQSLTLTGGQFSSGAIVWLHPNPKTNPNLDPNPNPKRGAFNNALNKGIFPNELKQADIKPIYKKESRKEKENYRPISILPNLSKIFERCMYDQLKDHFDKPLSKYQCGFRKGFSTQHCLLAMKEKLRKSLDSGGSSAALLTDLSKAFDCLPHDF